MKEKIYVLNDSNEKKTCDGQQIYQKIAFSTFF